MITPSTKMADIKAENLGHFEPLFNRSVPHILERIFFSLDIESFLSCRGVCREWNKLLSSPAYERQLKIMLERVIICLVPSYFCHIISDCIIRDLRKIIEKTPCKVDIMHLIYETTATEWGKFVFKHNK